MRLDAKRRRLDATIDSSHECLWPRFPHIIKGRPFADCYETRVIKRFRTMFRVPEHRFFSFGEANQVVVV
jgi:hypothetical protein